MLKAQEKQTSVYPEIVKPESWLTDRPRRASIETELWMGALAFVETVLDLDTDSRDSFLEIVRQWGSRGCQQVINDAISDRLNSYDYTHSIMQAKQAQRTIPALADYSVKLQEYEAGIRNGKFKNDDYIRLTSLVSEFAKMHCNRQSDYENDTCKITVEGSPLLYSVLIFKPLFIHLRKSPDKLDSKRFGGNLFNIIYSNPSLNQDKILKSQMIQRWAKLEWHTHNDRYYSRKAELFYKAKVNMPGKLVLLVDELSRQDNRNPRTVKRDIQKTISLIKGAVMPGIVDDDLN